MLRRFDGANWTDIADVKRWNGSSWVDCEFVRRWNGTAWVDVWTNKPFIDMYEYSNTMRGQAGLSARNFSQGANVQPMWRVNSYEKGNGGNVVYFARGNWTNPVITLTYKSEYYYVDDLYRTEHGENGWIRLRAIDSFYMTQLAYVGSYSGALTGTITHQMTGTFKEIGYEINFRYTGNSFPQFYNVEIYNFAINGKPCVPSDDCIFNS